MKKSLLTIFLLLNFIGYSQKIDKSKKELNASSSNSNTSSSSTSSRNSSARSSINNDDVPLLLQIAGYISYGILIGNYTYENHLDYNLTAHPFDGKNIGNYSEFDSISKKNFRLDIENQFLFNTNQLFGNHLDIKIRPSKYFYFDTDYYQIFEYDQIRDKTDNLSLFQFNLAYDRLRFENFNLGWTIGCGYIANGVNKFGFNYGLNAEYFLDKKISFQVDRKWSNINYQPVNSFKICGKYYKEHYFFSLGFENLKIATPTYNFIAFGAGIYF